MEIDAHPNLLLFTLDDEHLIEIESTNGKISFYIENGTRENAYSGRIEPNEAQFEPKTKEEAVEMIVALQAWLEQLWTYKNFTIS